MGGGLKGFGLAKTKGTQSGGGNTWCGLKDFLVSISHIQIVVNYRTSFGNRLNTLLMDGWQFLHIASLRLPI